MLFCAIQTLKNVARRLPFYWHRQHSETKEKKKMKQEGKGKKWSDPFFSACHWKVLSIKNGPRRLGWPG